MRLVSTAPVVRLLTSSAAVPAILAILLATPPAAAQVNPAFHLYIPPVTLNGSVPGEAHVLFDNTLHVQAWAFAVCHEPSELALLSAEFGSAIATINGGGQPGFADLDLYADGFTSGVVISLQGYNPLPPGVGREFAVAEYQALGAPPAITEAEFCAIAGPPPVQVAVVMDGATYMPMTTDGVIELLGARFIRADANGDLTIDIADPIFLGAYLFGGGDDPLCEAACDANGDLLVDVADMVFTLGHLFSQGPAPGAPFPDCGPEPVPSLECALPSPCP